MIEFIHILPPWLVAFSAVLIVLLLGALLGLVASGLEERRRAAEAARWNTRMAGLRAAEQLAQQALGAAIGPTQRLACCARPDYPDGAAYCISCGRRI